ncbi:Translation initiation factor eIF-2B subunit epsilon [Orchesella cincta]|uniref:Translation initiation factor eIF2B subunit epsilon n=1 Tax=Orchesella cincta TaxID=48709 RepID=A0A1D2NAG1_ORCCI|nr:Translation initiation factor eIF-2B subunit epsilon [Orchesella cincta]
MGKGEVEEQEDIFQAILLADNFGVSIFGSEWADKQNPGGNQFGEDDEDEEITQNKSKEDEIAPGFTQESLMHLGNRKLIDYALEALTVSGVQEIYIFCSTGTKGGDALKAHIKDSKWSDLTVKIQVICSEDCQSLGDALRELDAKGTIRNDFILMSTGVITNKGLKPWLEMHRATMKSDKGAVMTLVHRVVPEGHRSRSSNSRTSVVVDASTRKILAYNERVPEKRIKVPLASIKEEMEVYLDTVDSGIAICSSSVLPLFTDNFDFANMVDFIKGILMNEEIMGNTIYVHRLEKGYANKITDFDTYLGISNDIMERWTYPLVPDMPFGSNPDDSIYSMNFNFVYKVTDVECARNAMIGPNVIIGSKSKLNEGVQISKSSIGNNCVIGKNVFIEHCQIGNNVKIGDGSKIVRSILLDGSIIKAASSVGPMVIIAEGQTCKIAIEDTFEKSDDEEESDDEDDFKSEGSFAPEPDNQESDTKRFCAEVLESILRAFTDNVDLDNLAVEIHGSRTANFMYFDDVPNAVVKGIVGVPLKLYPDFEQMPPKTQWDKTSEVMVRFKKLMPQYVKTDKAQKIVLQALEEHALDNAYFRPLLMKVLHYYYDIDILSQEMILNWYKTPSEYTGAAELRKMVEKFIEWLETASEESDSEDDDE